MSLQNQGKRQKRMFETHVHICKTKMFMHGVAPGCSYYFLKPIYGISYVPYVYDHVWFCIGMCGKLVVQTCSFHSRGYIWNPSCLKPSCPVAAYDPEKAWFICQLKFRTSLGTKRLFVSFTSHHQLLISKTRTWKIYLTCVFYGESISLSLYVYNQCFICSNW